MSAMLLRSVCVNSLVHGDTMCPCGIIEMDRQSLNIDSGNGLLPDGTKPLPESMLSVDLS